MKTINERIINGLAGNWTNQNWIGIKFQIWCTLNFTQTLLSWAGDIWKKHPVNCSATARVTKAEKLSGWSEELNVACSLAAASNQRLVHNCKMCRYPIWLGSSCLLPQPSWQPRGTPPGSWTSRSQPSTGGGLERTKTGAGCRSPLENGLDFKRSGFLVFYGELRDQKLLYGLKFL